MATQSPLQPISDNIPSPSLKLQQRHYERVASDSIEGGNFIHTDSVYNALFNAASAMEARLKESLENYQQHDLQQWNLALTTMTNINKNMGDALNSIASNFR